MGSYVFLFFLSAILPHLALTTGDFGPIYRNYTCLNTGNYTSNSTYQRYLNLLLSSLPLNATTPSNGFYNASAGENPQKVSAVFLCRGDVPSDMCRRCVNASSQDIIQKCPNQKEAIIWYDECMLRYSNRSIFSRMEERPVLYRWNMFNISQEPKRFDSLLGGLINGLVTRVASGSSSGLFATGQTFFSMFENIYAMVQCTPDISPRDCGVCLEAAIAEIPNCCAGKRGGRVLMPSCNLRYETNPFFESEASVPAPTPVISPLPPPGTRNTTFINGEKSKSSQIVIVAVVYAVVMVMLVSIIWFILWRCKPKLNHGNMDEIRSVKSLQFDFGKIRASTDDFSDANKLGEGGFGAVYKGVLSNGHQIAVKRLSRNSGQGDAEFKNEVSLLAKLHHKNLVRLLGFCLEGEEKLLIYEFMPNASLDHFIYDPAKRAQLNWDKRYKIIRGIARGLVYLHEDSQHRIIHHDLKASNILLDLDMNAKISDFGVARLFIVEQSQGNTSRIVGTFGYMAPEYAMHGQFSFKSDVFSFGVLLLEIISGRKNTDFFQSESAKDLLCYAWMKWSEGMALDVMDPTLAECHSEREVTRCIHIALLCVQESVADRPTMASVVLMLSSLSMTLPSVPRPAFFDDSRIEADMPSREDISREAESDNSAIEGVLLQSINEAPTTEL